MSTKGTKIIKTICGDRLRLSPTRLVQIDHPHTIDPWYIDASEVKRAAKVDPLDRYVTIHTRRGSSFRTKIGLLGCTIGCCEFTPETFAAILKMFKIKTSKAGK